MKLHSHKQPRLTARRIVKESCKWFDVRLSDVQMRGLVGERGAREWTAKERVTILIILLNAGYSREVVSQQLGYSCVASLKNVQTRGHPAQLVKDLQAHLDKVMEEGPQNYQDLSCLPNKHRWSDEEKADMRVELKRLKKLRESIPATLKKVGVQGSNGGGVQSMLVEIGAKIAYLEFTL